MSEAKKNTDQTDQLDDLLDNVELSVRKSIQKNNRTFAEDESTVIVRSESIDTSRKTTTIILTIILLILLLTLVVLLLYLVDS